MTTGTTAPVVPAQSTLFQTIVADLHAGESWFADEAESAGMFLWNTLKGAFIALGPAAGKIVLDTLTGAVADAAGGKSIEQIETDALQGASTEGRAALAAAGSGVVQTVIAGMKNNLGQ